MAKKTPARKKGSSGKKTAAKPVKATAKKTNRKKAPAKSSAASTTYKSAADVPSKVVAEIKRLRKEGKTWLEVRKATGVRRPIAREAIVEESYARPKSGGKTVGEAEPSTKKKGKGKKTTGKKKAGRKGARKGTRSSTDEASAETTEATEKKVRKGRKRSGRVKSKSMDEPWFEDDTDTEEVVEELEDSTIRYVTPEQKVVTIEHAKNVKELRNSPTFGRVFSMLNVRTQKMHAIPMNFIIEVKDVSRSK